MLELPPATFATEEQLRDILFPLQTDRQTDRQTDTRLDESLT